MQVKKGVGSNLGSIFRPANFTGSKFDPKLRLDLGFELSPSQHRHCVTSASSHLQPSSVSPGDRLEMAAKQPVTLS